MYRLMGLAHAQLHRTYRHLAADCGQGTVEYVALILLVAGIFAAVVTAGGGTTGKSIAGKITKQITQQIEDVGNAKPAAN
jgi:enoyl-[acyl-carrier-protein] reductase (NADH)